MAERDLLFLDDLIPQLAAYNPNTAESQQREFIAQFYRSLNAPSSESATASSAFPLTAQNSWP